MVSRDILNSHSVSTLRKEISKTNVKGYSKMKKNEIIELMMKTPARFAHITMKEGKPKKEKAKKAEPKKAEPKKTESKKVMTKTTSGFTDGKVLSMPKAKRDKEPKKAEPKKEEKKVEEKLPQYDRMTARAVADKIVMGLKKEKQYEAITARSSNIIFYLKSNVPKIRAFAGDIASGGLAGLMRHKSVKGEDEIHSRDYIAELLEK
jgi:hypothetical protein